MQESIAQILVDRFGVDTLINTGIAGSLDTDRYRRYGDPTDALHHDMDATIFGDPAGQIPKNGHTRHSRQMKTGQEGSSSK